MLVVSSFILLSWQNEKDQLKHIQLLNDQETIQNLIQIALHEFSYTLDTLEPSDVKQSLKFDYMTGSVVINYNLSSQSKLRLELIVKLADHEEPSYTHVTHWNV
ncbi:hypothetical protein ACTWQB_07950 [Piscibacillus sp. B03]|uniref:hypothetical protein n=1 Tax=Piscibacillus sp. B03 TaxID=3457430 RepID=UPI003FCE43C3